MMSLRNPKIEDDITKEIGNVIYNVDKSLSSLTDAKLPKVCRNNTISLLADFLSDMLNNMQMQMSGAGSGKPKPGQQGMQLPDIIKQEGLGEKMKDGIKGEAR
jgi:hypothetical protein